MRRYLLVLALAGCATQPQVETKTQVVDTACTSFAVIKIPEEDLPKISDTLKQRILANDRAWVKTCTGH